MIEMTMSASKKSLVSIAATVAIYAAASPHFLTSTSATTAGRRKQLPITVAEARGRSTNTPIAFSVTTPVPPSATVVISQIYGGGGNSGATLTHDFIELYNLSATPITVTGWSVQYASASGTNWQKTNLGGTIQPGRFYLIQEARGAAGTVALPKPDAAGTIPMAATSGKIALVSGTTLLSGSCPAVGIVDFVGYGSANCSETSPAPVLSNATAALRNGNGTVDTNHNLNDFTAGAPRPRNSDGFPPSGVGFTEPPSAAPGEPARLQVAVAPGEFPAAGVTTVAADLTPLGGTPSQPLFDDGTHGDEVAGDNLFSFEASIPATASAGPKTIIATIVDAIDRRSTTGFRFTVETTVSATHDLQGSGTTSPYVGQFVTTRGIVTARKSNGLFLQTPDAEIDADPDTSEGIFAFTGAAFSAATAVGDLVKVSGTVTEFVPSADPVSPPFTEIGGGSTATPAVRVLTSMNALPSPALLTAADTRPAGSLEQLERFEGMRVHVDSLRAIAPTEAAFVDEEHATSVSNGVFYGVIDGLARPLREPGIQLLDPLPPGAPCCVPHFDGNPERLRVDSDGQIGATPIEVSAGALVSNVTGPLDYSFRTYTILPDPSSSPAVSALGSAVPVPAADANEFTVASFNMERFFDTMDDPSVDDVVLTPEAFENRLKKISAAIRRIMLAPDIIGVEEVENFSTLQAVAARINADAVAAGEPEPQYQAYLFEGNDFGGIDSGFLVKTARVAVVDTVQQGSTATFINPTEASEDLLNDRPPVVLRAAVRSPLGTLFPVTVIVNHLRSLSGIDGDDGVRIRAKRRAQAEFLANLIQARQVADPAERIVSVGDYNAFPFNDGYVDSIGTIKGMPAPADQVVLSSADLVNPDLINLVETLPPAERYSFSFDGNAQALDHVLVNAPLLDRFSRFHFARNNADFPESLRQDTTRPERISDHDMPVAYFFFHKVPVLTLNGPNPMMVECSTGFVDPGARASDETLGDLTPRIQVSGLVDAGTPGSYTLTYSVTNGILTTSMTRTVNVVDSTPPVLSEPTALPSVLWPPNHRMVDVMLSYGATDTCDPTITCTVSVTSNEPIEAAEGRKTAADWEIVNPFHVRLRAERAGNGSGRFYTIVVTCRDASGNATVRRIRVVVPHDR